MGRFVLELAEEGRHLSTCKGFLRVSKKGDELGRVPCEDITSVLFTAHSCTLTKQAIARMAEEGIIGIICGSNCMPTAMILPITNHFQSSGVMRDQINSKRPLCKRIWQTIIKGKITNQANTLESCVEESPIVQRLRVIERKVLSGDSGNMEALAARLYWTALLGGSFLRDPSARGVNSLLNYTYAILRSVVARAVCTAGLSPAIGVHHRNQNNAFCLVDDLMEPFRPIADKRVFRLVEGNSQWDEPLAPSIKREMAGIIESPLMMEGHQATVSSAAERMAQLLAESFRGGRNEMTTPTVF